MAKKKMSREELKEFKGGKYMGGPAEERAEKKQKGKRMAMGGRADPLNPNNPNAGVAPPRGGGFNPNKGYERPGMKNGQPYGGTMQRPGLGRPGTRPGEKGTEGPGMKNGLPDGISYTGGSPYFNESTGQYTGNRGPGQKGYGFPNYGPPDRGSPGRDPKMDEREDRGRGNMNHEMERQRHRAEKESRRRGGDLPRPDLGGGFSTRPNGPLVNNTLPASPYGPGYNPYGKVSESPDMQFPRLVGKAIGQTYKKGGRVKRMDAGGPVVSTPLPPAKDKMARRTARNAEHLADRRAKLTGKIAGATSKFNDWKSDYNTKTADKMADLTGDKLATFKTKIADKLADRTGNYNSKLGRLNSRLTGLGPVSNATANTTPTLRGGGLARKGVGQALAKGGMVKGSGCATRGVRKPKTY